MKPHYETEAQPGFCRWGLGGLNPEAGVREFKRLSPNKSGPRFQSFGYCLISRGAMLVSQGCCNEVPQTKCLKQQKLFVSPFETDGQRSEIKALPRGSFWGCERESSPPGFWGFTGHLWGSLVTTCIPLISTSLVTWRSPCVCISN